MISTESKYGAASAAKRVAKTEPIEKFGAINTPTLGWSANWFCKAWRLSSLQPEVPTTTWRLFLTANSTICGDTVGTVRSKTWVAPEDRMLSSESCDASSATSSRSSDELIAALAYCPILTVAPTRATLIGSDVVAGCVDMGLILLDTQSGCSCCAKDETAGPNAMFNPAVFMVARFYPSSPFSSMTGTNESFPRSSTLAISTCSLLPTATTSSTFSTRLPSLSLRSSEICSRPSLPGVSEMNAPKLVVFTTVSRYRSPTSG